VLEDYFGDILRFHINAMAVFSRPGLLSLGIFEERKYLLQHTRLEAAFSLDVENIQ